MGGGSNGEGGGNADGDLLSRKCSNIGAEDFHFRVRDGIGCMPLAMTVGIVNIATASPKVN